MNLKKETDRGVTKQILRKIEEFNVVDIKIRLENQPFMEEIRGYLSKILIVKGLLGEWVAKKDILDTTADEDTALRILGNMDLIEISGAEFLILSDKDLEEGVQPDLSKTIKLVSKLISAHYYCMEWLRYLSNKYSQE